MSKSVRNDQPTALEIPVTVQGSKPVEGSDRRELFTESTKTIVVFGNGAVLSLKSKLLPGQNVFLRNDKTGREILCKVRESPQGSQLGATDLEFTVYDPEFWDAPVETPQAVPAEEPASTEQKSEEPAPLEAAAKNTVEAPPREILVPAHEQVPEPPPVVATMAAQEQAPEPAPAADTATETHGAETQHAAIPEMAEAATAAPTGVQADQAVATPDSPASEGEHVDTKAEEQLATMMAADATRMARKASVAKKIKEPVPEAASADVPEKSEKKTVVATEMKVPAAGAPAEHKIRKFTTGKNPVGIGIAATVLLVAALGIGWNVKRMFGGHRNSTKALAASVQPPHAGNPAVPPGSSNSTNGAATAPSTQKVQQPAVGQVHNISTPKNSLPRTSGAPVEREITPTASLSASGATNVDASTRAAATGRPVPGKRHKGGESISDRIVPPKIVAQAQPTFPSWAKELDVEGVVKLDAVIDEKGNVTQTRVLSGPRALQRAAEEAVALWIFEPAQEDGKPTSMHMVLTVEFQR